MDDKKRNTISETCEECDLDFERPAGRFMHRCYDCRKKRMMINVDAQKYRNGDAYIKTVRKQVAYWRSEAKRLGIRA